MVVLVADPAALQSYELMRNSLNLVMRHANPYCNGFFETWVSEFELFLHVANVLSIAQCNVSACTFFCSLLLGCTCCASVSVLLFTLGIESKCIQLADQFLNLRDLGKLLW